MNRTKIIQLPEFDASAKKRWHQLPETVRKEIIDTVWCGKCRTGVHMQLREGAMSRQHLILRGTCKQCGGEVARVIEPVEE